MSKKPKLVEAPKASFAMDPTVFVILEACDGHRLVVDRNCVAVSRRLADLIPPLIAPPPPPAVAARGAAKNEQPQLPPVNRGPSKVSPLFEADLGPGHPAPLSSVCASSSPSCSSAAAGISSKAAAAAAAAASIDSPVPTAIVPVVKIDCLDGRQLEAAMRIAHLKYLGDNTPEISQRRTVSLDKLGISADELMAIGTILGM